MRASTPRGPYDEVSTNVQSSSRSGPPPRAVKRSCCTGARPAPATKQIRRSGWFCRPAAYHAHQAADELRRVVHHRGHQAGRVQCGRVGAPPVRDAPAPGDRPPRQPGAAARAAPRRPGWRVGPPAAAARRIRRRAARRSRPDPGSTAGTDAQARKRSGRHRDAVVPGRQQAVGLGGGQRLDAQRRRQAEQHEIAGIVGADTRIVVRRVDLERRFTLEEQDPAAEKGWGRAGPQRVEESGRPEVLMDVHGGSGRQHICLPRPPRSERSWCQRFGS